jgi:phospholipase C
MPEQLFQEAGVRRSRALPYELHAHAHVQPGANILKLTFRNTRKAGAVFHVYDKLHLDRIPRRYTVEAGRQLSDDWLLHVDEGRYDLWVYGPNGFVREFRGVLRTVAHATPEVELQYDAANRSFRLLVTNQGPSEATLAARAIAYRTDGALATASSAWPTCSP